MIKVITATEPQTLRLDHVDRGAIVYHDPDQTGLRDKEYRARRNAIAQIAMTYKPGSPIPTAPYTELEHGVWSKIWEALGPAHRAHACAEYLDCLDRLAFDPDRIPQLDEVSQKVEAISGFRLEPVERGRDNLFARALPGQDGPPPGANMTGRLGRVKLTVM